MSKSRRGKEVRCSCYLCQPHKHGKPSDRLKPSERRRTQREE